MIQPAGSSNRLPHRGALIVEVHSTLDIFLRAERNIIRLALRIVAGIDGGCLRLSAHAVAVPRRTRRVSTQGCTRLKSAWPKTLPARTIAQPLVGKSG